MIDQDENNLNMCWKNGATPLHVAIYMLNPELVEYLINKGANIEARFDFRDGYNFTPLHVATNIPYDYVNHYSYCVLSDKKSKFFVDSDTMLSKQHEIIKLLLDNNANLEAPCYFIPDDCCRVLTPFSLAFIDMLTTAGNVLELLINKGANLNTNHLGGLKVLPILHLRRDSSGTPLPEPGKVYAQKTNGGIQYIMLSLDGKKTITNEKISNKTLNEHLLKDYLTETTYYDLINEYKGFSAETRSFSDHHHFLLDKPMKTFILNLVVQRFAFNEPPITHCDRTSVLHNLLYHCFRKKTTIDNKLNKDYVSYDAVKQIVLTRNDIKITSDICDDDGNTLLHLATRLNDCHFVKILLERGLNADKRNEKGETPLGLALSKSKDMIKIFLSYNNTEKLKVAKEATKFSANLNESKEKTYKLKEASDEVREDNLQLAHVLLNNKDDNGNKANPMTWLPMDIQEQILTLAQPDYKLPQKARRDTKNTVQFTCKLNAEHAQRWHKKRSAETKESEAPALKIPRYT